MAKSPLRWLGGLLVVYLVAPVLLFVLRFARSPERGFHVAGLFPSLFISMSCASVSLVVVCVLGVPLAYVLGRSTSRFARVVEMLTALPLALPPVAAPPAGRASGDASWTAGPDVMAVIEGLIADVFKKVLSK